MTGGGYLDNDDIDKNLFNFFSFIDKFGVYWTPTWYRLDNPKW